MPLVERCDKTVLPEQTDLPNICEQETLTLESQEEELGATVSPSFLTLGMLQGATYTFSSKDFLARIL